MRVIVIGAGEVGTNIARHLVQEEQDVVIVDKDSAKLRHVSEHLDVKVVKGVGSYPNVLEEAGCDHADMLVAVTQSDETNMVACQMAYSLFNVPMKIARVRHASYLSVTRQRVYTPENMPVDVIISPEMEVADAILRTMEVPGIFDAAYFGDNKIALMGVHVEESTTIGGVPLRKLASKLEVPFRVMAIFRDGRLIVPGGSDHIEPGDEIFVVCARRNTEDTMAYLGFDRRPTRRVFVIGGGNIGYDICRRLEEHDMNIRVLEKEKERAEYLADRLDRTTVLLGDALDRELLLQENIGEMDEVISATSNDAANVLSTILAKRLGAKSVITLVNQSAFIDLGESLHIDKIISPREITASRILQFIRRGQVMALHTIHDGQAEVLEVLIHRESALAGADIKSINLPSGAAIGAVYTVDGKVVLPDHDTVLKAGDRAIIFSTAEHIHQVEELV